jgi:hypothetical protein
MKRWRATEIIVDSAVVADMVECESDGYYLASEVDKQLEQVKTEHSEAIDGWDDLLRHTDSLDKQLEQVKSWMYLRLSEKGCEHPDACGCGECEGCRFDNELTERFDELAAILKEQS